MPGYFQAWNVYGPGPDEILLRQGGKYGYMRFHLDRHGNVAFLVDNDGVIQEKYTYDVFGKPKIMNAAGTERPFSYYGHCFLFQGREYIRQLGIYDYRHRFYHPELGNFIQVDPLGLQTEGAKLSAEQTALYGDGAPSAFSSSELNLYRYCDDDPINKSDPMGLFKEDYEYTDPKQAQAMRAIITRILARGDEWSAKVREMRAAHFPVKFIPVQTNDKGLDRYNLPRHAENPPGNRTTPRNEPNSYNRTGTGTTVELDPTNQNSPNGQRDPIIAAIHEIAGHVLPMLNGTRLHGRAEEDRAQQEELRFRQDLKKKP